MSWRQRHAAARVVAALDLHLGTEFSTRPIPSWMLEDMAEELRLAVGESLVEWERGRLAEELRREGPTGYRDAVARH